jgi:hypothetical protein
VGSPFALDAILSGDQGDKRDVDKVENYLAGKVRRGEMSLPEAQQQIQHWQSVDTTR